ncbi:hypothetical protein ABT124_09685 [Streptomyces sp. NPDC001982]|uniref:hypothetical protein n=1 Tax=unclassified Streptomyces TaxID=2593676 RepID=UPI0033302DA9
MTGGDTQAFPETGRTGVFGGGREERGGAVPPGSGKAGRTPAGADETAVLPRAREARDGRTGTAADPTAVLSASGTAGPSGSLRDPWGDSLAATVPGGDATHDPHEVTIQLDAVQLGDTRLRPATGSPVGGGQDGSDGPVFVDASGRRSRRFRRLGMLVGVACAVYAVVIVATLMSGSSDAPWLPVPGQNVDKPAGQVDTPPLPAESVQPSGSGSASPGVSPTASDGAPPSPGVGGTTPGTGSSSGKPGTAGDPEPTATKTAPGTTGGGGTSTKPKPPSSDPSTPASPDPSPPVDTDPSPDPSESSATGDAGAVRGNGSLAHGPSTPMPIAEEPGAPASSATYLSPEHTL